MSKWNKGKPAAKGVYEVNSGETAAYSHWNGAVWAFTAPTAEGAKKYIGSRSKYQNRGWREIEAVPA